MGRLVQAKGIRLGFNSSWALDTQFSLVNSYNVKEVQEYLLNICNNFYLKNSIGKVLFTIFDKVSIKVNKDVIFVDIYLYDGELLDILPNIDTKNLSFKLLFLESIIFDSIQSIYLRPSVVKFHYLKNTELNANLLVRYIEIKFLQGFSLVEISNSFQRIMKSTKGLVGYRFDLSGRFTRKQRASHLSYKAGSVPFSCISSNIDYSEGMVVLKYGKCGIKLWLNYSANESA